MKVLVDNMPKTPAECLFSIDHLKRDNTKRNGVVACYACSMNNKLCDLAQNGKCDKLKCMD